MDAKKRQSNWPAGICVACIALPVLYVLGIGPACWLVRGHVINLSSVTPVYRPLVEIIDSGPPVIQDAARWYCDAPRPPRVGGSINFTLKKLADRPFSLIVLLIELEREPEFHFNPDDFSVETQGVHP